MDICFKFFAFNDLFSLSTVYIILFNSAIAIIMTLLETLFTKIINKILSIIFTLFIIAIYISQFIYFKFYDAIYSIYSLFHGGQVFEFMESIMDVVLRNIVPIIIFILPFILFLILFKKLDFERKNYKFYIILLPISILLHVLVLFLINSTDKNEVYSSYGLYYNTHVPKLTVKDFGVLTEMRLDLKRTIFGFNEKIVIQKEEQEEVVIEKEVKYHVIDIDFDKLIENENDKSIKEMHEYFNSIMPLEENDYTGMFKGKNLIVFVAEAFSPMAVNKELTPTLYKLYEEGFQFTNFYTPVFYVSTSDGEYTSLQSLLPKNGTWSMSVSSDHYLPFVYGNLFKKYGYNTRAYHDGWSTYYNRHLSHPNMGYTYKACGNGLNINCNIWPQSDIEMIEKSVDDYINEDHFMTYYLTVSGHLRYTYMGNRMASKNKKYVIDMPYSEPIQAYLATQIELDRAIEVLIEKLKEAGKLDDTVIAISADHYPYGLEKEDIVSYADYVEDAKYDIHKNTFLLWNSKMENSIKVTKYASSLDILPTVLNLFGLKYDSRLLMGNDILSDKEGIVIFNDRSWISSYGKFNMEIYNKTSKKSDEDFLKAFTPSDNNNMSDEDTIKYIKKTVNTVYNKFIMSTRILDKDYYRKILNDSYFEDIDINEYHKEFNERKKLEEENIQNINENENIEDINENENIDENENINIEEKTNSEITN